jgi:hypothetical protein
MSQRDLSLPIRRLLASNGQQSKYPINLSSTHCQPRDRAETRETTNAGRGKKRGRSSSAAAGGPTRTREGEERRPETGRQRFPHADHLLRPMNCPRPTMTTSPSPSTFRPPPLPRCDGTAPSALRQGWTSRRPPPHAKDGPPSSGLRPLLQVYCNVSC